MENFIFRAVNSVGGEMNFVLTADPFYATVLLLYLLKTSENIWFSHIFRLYEKRSMV